MNLCLGVLNARLEVLAEPRQEVAVPPPSAFGIQSDEPLRVHLHSLDAQAKRPDQVTGSRNVGMLVWPPDVIVDASRGCNSIKVVRDVCAKHSKLTWLRATGVNFNEKRNVETHGDNHAMQRMSR